MSKRENNLAGLLAALHYGQYSTHEDKQKLDAAIEKALEDFDIGMHEFEPAVPTTYDTTINGLRFLAAGGRSATYTELCADAANQLEALANSEAGVVASHAIITPTCRSNRGNDGAMTEALTRVTKAYKQYVMSDNNSNVEWHVKLLRVQPR